MLFRNFAEKQPDNGTEMSERKIPVRSIKFFLIISGLSSSFWAEAIGIKGKLCLVRGLNGNVSFKKWLGIESC